MAGGKKFVFRGLSEMKTRIDIIEEVRWHYTSLNRSSGWDGYCRYSKNLSPPEKDSILCAVGRYIDPIKVPRKFWRRRDDIHSIAKKFELKRILKAEVKHLADDLNFWEDLQTFHDRVNNWDAFGLNEDGFEEYEELIEKYK
jgi:hypothetical protein